MECDGGLKQAFVLKNTDSGDFQGTVRSQGHFTHAMISNDGQMPSKVLPMIAGRSKSGRKFRTVTALLGVVAGLSILPGCSSTSSKRHQAEREEFASTPILSPEQCEANGQIEQASAREVGYRIQAGDQLAISFYLNSEFNQDITVAPDGKAMMLMIGPVQAAGLTPDQMASNLNKAYQSELRNPGATVHVKNMPGRQIYVQGEVAKPGSFSLQPGMTALQAVADAGGFTPDSAPGSVVLIRRDACGQPQASKVNLQVAMKDPGAGDDPALMSHDVVVVPRSTIANIDLFVKQYVRDVLPVQPYVGIPF